MKITKRSIEFTLCIDNREEIGWFDGHVFSVKGVKADQIERIGAAIEREFAEMGEPAARRNVDAGGRPGDHDEQLEVEREEKKAASLVANRGGVRTDAEAIAQREKADAERAGEKDARARRDAERKRQELESEERIARQHKAQEEEERRNAAQLEEQARLAQAKKEEEQARAIAEGQKRTARVIAEQEARDKAAREKEELDSKLERAAADDAARKSREALDKASSKPEPVKPHAGTAPVAPNGAPVPAPPSELLLPTAKLRDLVIAVHALGFRTLDDIYFVLFTVWEPHVPLLRGVSGTEGEKRARLLQLCTLKNLPLADGSSDEDDEEEDA